MVEVLNEVNVFLNILEKESLILAYKRNVVFGLSKGLDISLDEMDLNILKKSTQVFGVSKDEYLNWYEYYLRHFNKVLNKEQFREFLDKRSKGEDVTSYLPLKTYKQNNVIEPNKYVKLLKNA